MKKILLFLLFAFTCSLTYGQASYDDGADDGTVIEQRIANDLQVFPNPAMDFISLNDYTGVKKIAIYNLIGNEVMSFDVDARSKYYVSDLRIGMYLVQVIGIDSKTITTLRLSKK